MAVARLGAGEFDIFISYAREDTARVQLLVSALDAEGWRIFWDQDILAGETWQSYIGVHLDAAPIVLTAWSHHSVESRFVRSEATRGLNRSAYIPVLLDAVEPPFGFDHINAFNLRAWLDAGGGVLPERLTTALKRKIAAAAGTPLPIIPTAAVQAPGKPGDATPTTVPGDALDVKPGKDADDTIRVLGEKSVEEGERTEQDGTAVARPSQSATHQSPPLGPASQSSSGRSTSVWFYLVGLLAVGGIGYATMLWNADYQATKAALVASQADHQATKEELQVTKASHQTANKELQDAQTTISALQAQVQGWEDKEKEARREKQRATDAAAVQTEADKRKQAQAAALAASQADQARLRKHAPIIKALEDYYLHKGAIQVTGSNEPARRWVRLMYLSMPTDVARQITRISYKTVDGSGMATVSKGFEAELSIPEACRSGDETLLITATLQDGDIIPYKSDSWCRKWKTGG